MEGFASGSSCSFGIGLGQNLDDGIRDVTFLETVPLPWFEGSFGLFVGDSLFTCSEEVSEAAMRVLVLFWLFLSMCLLCCHSLGHFESREWMRLLEEIKRK